MRNVAIERFKSPHDSLIKARDARLGERHTFIKQLNAVITKVFDVPPEMTLIEWANTFRYLPKSSAESGKWRSERMFCALEPMQAVTDPNIRRITIMSPTQLMKTELLLNTAFYFIHHDPSPILFVLPTTNLARMVATERFEASMQYSPVLQDLLDFYSDQPNTILQKNFHAPVSFASANNPGELASRSIRILLMDEVDKYPRSSGKEGDSILIAGERTEWFQGEEKIIATCSPTIKGLSRIEEEYENSDMRVFMHKCKHCDFEFAPDIYRNMYIPGKDEGKPKPKKAQMVCHNCDTLWSEADRIFSIQKGHYHKQNPEVTDHAGFNMSRFASPFEVVPKIANKLIEAGNDQMKLMVVINTQMGQSFRMTGSSFEWKDLYNKREDYKIGVVPEDAIYLFDGVDVQSDCVYRETIAVCKGLETYVVKAEVIDGDIDEEKDRIRIAKILKEPLLDTNGVSRKHDIINIDAGYKTNSVIALVALMRADGTEVRLVNGQGTQSEPISAARKVQVRMSGVKRKSSLKLFPVNSSLLKETIYGFYSLEAPTESELKSGMPYPAGYHHIPQLDEDYFKQATSEVRDEEEDTKGQIKYIWRKIRRENHFLDCKVYAFAAIYMKNLDTLTYLQWEEIYKQRPGAIKKNEPKKNFKHEKDLTRDNKVTKNRGGLRITR